MKLQASVALLSLLPTGILSFNKTETHPLVLWLRQNGGYFNSMKQEVRLENPQQPQDSRYGIFATSSIANGEVLSRIPWGLIVSLSDDEEEEEEEYDNLDTISLCSTALYMANEMSIGSNSKLAPYLDHLKSYPSKYKLPRRYTPPAALLFLQVLFNKENIPEDFYNAWQQQMSCEEYFEGDELARVTEAAALIQQHAMNGLMIPISDMYTHRNGWYHNTKLEVSVGEDVQIVASRDITQGEQLHSSYTKCEDCTVEDDIAFGTPDVFRDHGILEAFPQRWSVRENHMFAVDEDDEIEYVESGLEFPFLLKENLQTGEVYAELLFDDVLEIPIYGFVDTLFRSRIQDLYRLKNILTVGTREEFNIPEQEWASIWEFHEAYVNALKLATLQLNKQMTELGLHPAGPTMNSTQIQNEWNDHYTDFNLHLEHIALTETGCESSEHVDFDSYEVLEHEKSNYQNFLWQYRSTDDDTCLHLDGMLQICSSYRPHYHEFFVHYPARYLNSIKRVIFLGSGDAMLLHEILKYPSLEKVVGLELDQTVTRKSFKHFKTQPHYDDPRVEWWYGDATKTLPLLPREYWGSFDLLLVDLSETVVSLHVTGQHDVLDVISMLLKPDGIMLENENYIDKMSSHFDHTVHIYYGSPKVCVQVQTVSSNSVDFIRAPIYNHDIHTYLLDEIHKESDKFRYIHDYAKTNPIAGGKCGDLAGDEIDTVHGRKAGIMLVLEAEEVKIPLDKSLGEIILSVLRAEKLSPLDYVDLGDRVFQVIMKEGYIVARSWPELQYIAFDINFWGTFATMESVKLALANAVQSQVTSSYRIVVGGMHGSSTWEHDQNSIGIQFSKKRNCTSPDQTEKVFKGSDVIATSLLESIQTLNVEPKMTAMILCGKETDKDDCSLLKVLEKHESVNRIIPIWTCKDIPSFKNTTENLDEMYQCERELIAQLEYQRETLGVEINALVVDLSTPLSMLQIFSSIWSLENFRDLMLAETFFAAMPYSLADPMRKHFLDIVRKFFYDSVTTMADLELLGSMEEQLGWEVFTYGSPEAVHSFSKLSSNLEAQMPEVEVTLRRLESGLLHAEKDLTLEKERFRPEDYDYGPNKKQMSEQKPLGRQTIFQFEVSENATMPGMEEVTAALRLALEHVQHRISHFESSSQVGDGIVTRVVLERGDIMLVWDGLHHVDINIFCLDESRALADNFLLKFEQLLNNRLKWVLRDDQPRGVGRVVNFQIDIGEENTKPGEVVGSLSS